MYSASVTDVFLGMYEFFKNSRSSHRRCSIKKVFLKTLQNSQENTCVGASLVSLESTLLKRDFNTDISCEYYEIFKNTYFKEHLGTTAS